MLADGPGYRLWLAPETASRTAELAQSYDVFSCSVGECDRSFDFSHWRCGELVRAWEVASPKFTDRQLVKDVGQPLDGEYPWEDLCDELDHVLRPALLLGVDLARLRDSSQYFYLHGV
jgi:hypothetical protein